MDPKDAPEQTYEQGTPDTPVTRYIIVSGNPVDGFTYSGPFLDHEEAEQWAMNKDRGDTWWIAEMEGPL